MEVGLDRRMESRLERSLRRIALIWIPDQVGNDVAIVPHGLIWNWYLLLVASIILIAAAAHSQQPADGRWLDEETWQPRNQNATIDNSSESGGYWPVISGWEPDVRLTEFIVPHAHWPDIAVYDNKVYVAWWYLENNTIHFVRSTDHGYTWYENVQISDSSTYNAVIPKISAWGDNVYVVYKAYRPYQGIYLRRSTDSGATWQETQSLYYTARNLGGVPVVTSFGDNVYVVFRIKTETTPPQDWDLYMVKSTDSGQSWGDTTFVSDTTVAGIGPDLSLNGAGLHLIRGENLLSSSTTEIIYNRSTNEGDSWDGPFILSYNDTSGSFWPQIAAWGHSNVIVSWTDYKYSPYAWTGDAFICRSTDNGESWSQPVQMTDLHLVKATDISADGDTILLVYSDFRYGDREIMANVSYDGGLTWEGEERLTDALGHSIEPSCEIRGGIGHATWCDARNNPDMNYYEVYYKRGDLQTGIWEPNQNIPIPDRIVNSYPNPFNSSTTLEFYLPGDTETELSILNLLGQKVAVLYKGSMAAGEHRMSWDATAHPSGIYFARLRAGDKSDTRKMIFIK
ncbi:MAG: T9SS type A sorting domain-containing protein [Candidatus Zixiibacteriota bacterium]|nr:MAG: T9SS type A sorting domain-containing protein [candidate division Zixibacteria bacterium]